MPGIVIDNKMDLQVARHTPVDVAQKRDKFLMVGPPPTWADDRLRRDIQGGEQGRGAVTDMVVRHTLDVASPRRRTGCVRFSAWIFRAERLRDEGSNGVIG